MPQPQNSTPEYEFTIGTTSELSPLHNSLLAFLAKAIPQPQEFHYTPLPLEDLKTAAMIHFGTTSELSPWHCWRTAEAAADDDQDPVLFTRTRVVLTLFF
jgi:hypothetical protein